MIESHRLAIGPGYSMLPWLCTYIPHISSLSFKVQGSDIIQFELHFHRKNTIQLRQQHTRPPRPAARNVHVLSPYHASLFRSIHDILALYTHPTHKFLSPMVYFGLYDTVFTVNRSKLDRIFPPLIGAGATPTRPE